MRRKAGTKTVTQEVHEHVCDACGEVMPDDGSVGSDVDIVCRSKGPAYSDWDGRSYTWLDCCAKCFAEKVAPAIEAAGIKLRRGDYDDWLAS